VSIAEAWILFLLLALIASCAFNVWQDERRAKERKEWTAERKELLNRIQVPQAAPFMENETTEVPAYVPFDDDDAFHDAVEEAGLRADEG
jgi:hypothetical protein